MKKETYLIADIIFDISWQKDFVFPAHREFILKENENIPPARTSLSFRISSLIRDMQTSPGSQFIKYEKSPDSSIIYIFDSKGRAAHKIIAENNWKTIDVLSAMRQKLPFGGSAGEVIFRNLILFHSGFVIHASAIDYKGAGIIFSGPSGSGKSTHAGMWKKQGAVVLNGDRPAVRKTAGGVYVYGTPWAGTSGEYASRKAPLRCIVMIEREGKTSLRRLDNEEALRLMIPRCYISYFSRELISRALDNLGKVIETVPVYHLAGGADEGSMELVKRCL
jgi:hypothetical protein